MRRKDLEKSDFIYSHLEYFIFVYDTYVTNKIIVNGNATTKWVINQIKFI